MTVAFIIPVVSVSGIAFVDTCLSKMIAVLLCEISVFTFTASSGYPRTQHKLECTFKIEAQYSNICIFVLKAKNIY